MATRWCRSHAFVPFPPFTPPTTLALSRSSQLSTGGRQCWGRGLSSLPFDSSSRDRFSSDTHDDNGAHSTTTITSGPSAIRSQRPSPTNATELQMVSFYHFFEFGVENKEALRDTVFEELSHSVPGVRGTLYIADEGINGQFAVPVDVLDAFVAVCEAHLFQQQDCQERLNWGDRLPIDIPTFQKLIVRTRNVILRDGLSTSLDWNQAGEELSPADWDRELRQTTIASSSSSPWILDCRNDYETEQGTFHQATPLNTTTFSESWDILQQLANNDTVLRNDPVYIFCTGGIRCVKVGAYMTQTLGFSNVKRLKHGIIGYQKWHQDQQQQHQTATDQHQPSLWVGENFLFDKRRFAEESIDAPKNEEKTTANDKTDAE